MMNLTQGNILDAEAEALVNTVNCVGIMGRGIALQFRKAYPENYKFYKQQLFYQKSNRISRPRNNSIR